MFQTGKIRRLLCLLVFFLADEVAADLERVIVQLRSLAIPLVDFDIVHTELRVPVTNVLAGETNHNALPGRDYSPGVRVSEIILPPGFNSVAISGGAP